MRWRNSGIRLRFLIGVDGAAIYVAAATPALADERSFDAATASILIATRGTIGLSIRPISLLALKAHHVIKGAAQAAGGVPFSNVAAFPNVDDTRWAEGHKPTLKFCSAAGRAVHEHVHVGVPARFIAVPNPQSYEGLADTT